MQWSDISFAPSSRTLRQFAGIWLVFFGGLTCWQAFVRHQSMLAIVFLVLAVAVGPLGLARPQAIRWVYTGCMIVTFPIGWTVSRIILAVLFYLVFTPVAVFFRMVGRDVLERQQRPDQATYWAPKAVQADMRNYLRQF